MLPRPLPLPRVRASLRAHRKLVIPRPSPETVLVLGGGGMKGLAHVGAWRALTELGIVPDAIVGTSVGALIGALIAAGRSPRELADMASRLEREDILKLNRRSTWLGGVRQPSLFLGTHFQSFLRRTLPVVRFSDLAMPLRVNALSLADGTEYWLGSGADEGLAVADAVYASAALPLFFPPLERSGDLLIDGGLRSIVGAAEAIRWGARRLIVVDVSSDFRPLTPGWLDNGMAALHARVVQILAEQQRDRLPRLWADIPTLFVRPAVGHLDSFTFDATQEILDAGYEATRAAVMSESGAAFLAAGGTSASPLRRFLTAGVRTGLNATLHGIPRSFRRLTDTLTGRRRPSVPPAP